MLILQQSNTDALANIKCPVYSFEGCTVAQHLIENLGQVTNDAVCLWRLDILMMSTRKNGDEYPTLS